MDVEALSTLSASAIGRALAAGAASPVDLTEYLLSKIEAQTSPVFLNATVARARAEASAAAERLRDGWPLSPLDGVPIAWKDLVDIKNERTTAASDVYRDAAPAVGDAPIVANAAAAGMVSLGKLNLTEFAYSGLGLNPHFGTPLNPHSDIPRSPGGSSSGSGVSVASGLSPVSVGTDTGGSVRIPAAFNGVVGYKSSAGRISTTGVFALSRTLDTIGPLARTVEDCVLADMILRGSVTSQVVRRPVSTLRLFVPTWVVFDDIEPAVESNFEAALDRLAAAGADVERGECPAFEKSFILASTLGTITSAEAYAEHKHLMDTPIKARIDRRVVSRIESGRRMQASQLIELHRGRVEGMAELASQLGDRLLAMPTCPIVAPEIAPLEADDDVFHRTNLLTLRNTAIGNFLDTPGVAIPSGCDHNGMPTSFLLSACAGDDDRLLGAALCAEPLIRGAQ